MKIFLDDERPAPDPSWVVVREGHLAISLLETNSVEEISLDHDLGEGVMDGEDVLLFIERKHAFHEYTNATLPKIHIHTMNPVARERMSLTLQRMLARGGARE